MGRPDRDSEILGEIGIGGSKMAVSTYYPMKELITKFNKEKSFLLYSFPLHISLYIYQ